MRLGKSDLELEVLYNRIQRGELDLQPDFQRGEVWNRPRQLRLIDTILRQWYVPAVHIVRQDTDPREYVLDGQQRLRTIYSFFKDELRVDGHLEPYSPSMAELNGYTYSALPDNYRRRFQRFELTVITLTDFEPSEPSELFFRLNQQYSLTPPEKRNALFGLARNQVKDVVIYLTELGVLDRTTIGFSNGRLAYDDVVSRFCLALQEQTLRVPITNAYVEDFYRHRQFDPDVLEQAKDSGRQLGEVLRRTGRIRFNKATLFTWLVFIHSKRARDTDDLGEFLRKFDELRARQDSLDRSVIHRIIEIYNDRSSYRVQDIASILLRDLAVHLTYVLLGQSNKSDSDLLALIYKIEQREERAEEIMLDYVQATEWGAGI